MPARHPNLTLIVCLVGALAVHALVVPMGAQLVAGSGPGWPALVLTPVQAPDEADAGARIEVGFSVVNTGIGEASPPWDDALLLSRDRVADNQDIELFRATRSDALSPNSTYGLRQAIDLADDLDGPYFLIAVADADGTASDPTPHDRRTARRAVWINGHGTPTVNPRGIDAPDTALAGGVLEATVTVTNAGDAWAPPGWNDVLYLSRDDVLDEADLALGERPRKQPLAPDESYDVSFSVVLPVDAGGAWHLLARSRDGGIAARAITLETIGVPDLVVTSADVPQRIVSGQEFKTSFRVANHGSESTGNAAWIDRVYLSADDTLDADDTPLAEAANALPLEPGQQYRSGEHALTLGKPQVPTAYLLFVADDEDAVFEDHYVENNVLAVAFEWLEGRPTDELMLGRDEPSPPLAVAWISHEALQELRARQSRTEQPALQTQMDPVPDAPPITDPAPPTVRVERPADVDAPIVADRPPTEATQQTASLDPNESQEQTDPAADAQIAAAARGEAAGAPSTALDPTTGDDPAAVELAMGDAERGVGSGATQGDLDTPDIGTNPERAGDAERGGDQPTEGENPDPSPSTEKSETDATQPDEDEQPTPPTVTAQQPREGGTPTSAARSDREAPPTQLTDKAVRVEPGEVITVEGIEIVTSAPRFSVVARASAQPRNPVMRVLFDADGTVLDVEFVRDSGAENVDGPVLAAMYRWKARGEKLKELGRPFVQEFSLLLR